MIVYPFPYFRNFTTGTPTIPDIYWNCYSYEERIKKLCCEYDKITKYLDAMADTVNSQYVAIEEINDNLVDKIIQAIDGDPETKQAILQAVQDYINSMTVGHTYQSLKDNGFLYPGV